MLRQKDYPIVAFDDSGSFIDISLKMLSYGRDSSVLPMETDDFLYFGRIKPFDAFYIEMAVPNVIASNLLVEYWNGSAWVTVGEAVDDTNCFSRSGFIQFTKPTDWAEKVVNSLDGYYIRMSVSVDVTATMEIQGINIVFSDDQDLNGVYPGVTAYLSSNETTFILRHENARDLIVQEIRNRGFRKNSISALKIENYDPWDFLHIEEVRLWSLYLALSNIFSSLQSKETDLYKEKAEEYAKKAEYYKAAFYLSLDSDNDGIEDVSESAAGISSRRVVRG